MAKERKKPNEERQKILEEVATELTQVYKRGLLWRRADAGGFAAERAKR